MSVKVSRILHAGYLFQHDQTTIAFDPVFESPFSQNCYAFPPVEFDHQKILELSLNAVFISHYHDDHFSIDSLKYLNRQTPIYMFCIFDKMFELLRQLGFTNVNSLKLGQIVKINSFEIICHPALDVDVDCVFQIKAAGLNILNVVDSWIDPETFENLKKQKPWDLVLWPFQLMREIETLSPRRSLPWDGDWPVEWKDQLAQLAPRVLIPSSCQFIFESWSWLNRAYFPVSYQFFKREMNQLLPKTQIERLDPSESLLLETKTCFRTDSLPWIQKISDQILDYQYDPDAKPTSTAEIAKHFPPLPDLERSFVFRFCRTGLLEKWRALNSSGDLILDDYFTSELIWKLSAYDHLGTENSFYYKINGCEIHQIDCTEALSVGWFTEISLYKMHRALCEGESLTSLYLRINGCLFEDMIEEKLKDVDIMNDPLLRCLYEGQIASYQTAQLRKYLQNID